MNWPDDYLIPGIEPYHVEDAGIIYCADCRDILPHLPKVDLVLTDPPWNLGYFANDDNPWINYAKWLNEIKKILEEMSKTVWIFQSTKAVPYVAGNFKGWNCFANTKSFCQLIKNRISNAWDIAFFNNGDSYTGESGWRNWHLANNSNRHNTNRGLGHPTIRPLDTMKYIVALYSHQIILDPFLGSGTTAVAAKELGRKFIGIEISEEYCAIAVKRLRQGVLDFG
jgi:site-specific DNA-methyltransferase (adenine-specific)